MVADGNDRGADAEARELRIVAGHLLRRRRHRLGVAGDADHQLDGAAGRLNLGVAYAFRWRKCDARQDHAHGAQ